MGLYLFFFILVLLVFIFSKKLGYQRRHWYGIILAFSLVFAGLSITNNYDEIEIIENAKYAIKGQVTDVLKEDNRRQNLVCDAYVIDENQTCHQKIIVYNKLDSLNDAYSLGDELLIYDNLRVFKRTKNPYAFEYADYLKSRDIYYSASSTSENTIKLSSHHTLNYWLYQLRSHAQLKLKHLNLNDKEYALISALLLGDKSYLDAEVKEHFSHSGAMHMLAVSGLHLGVVFMVMSLLLGQIAPTKTGRLKVIVMLLVLWMYAAVSGMSPSIVRASIMFSVYLLAKVSRERYNVYNALIIAAFILLICDPYAIIQVGFWMSFLAVASIVYLYPYINSWFYFKKPWWRYIWNMVAVSIAAQAGTVFLSLAVFGFFPTWFLLTNILVLPVLPIVLVSALIIILAPAGSLIAVLFSGILADALSYMTQITDWVSQLPYAAYYGIQLSFSNMLLVYMGIIAFIVWRYQKKARYIMYVLAIMVVMLSYHLFSYVTKSEETQLIVANVFGKSILITNDSENCCVYANGIPDEKTDRYIIRPIQLSNAHQEYQTKICDSLLLYTINEVNRKVIVVNGAKLKDSHIHSLSDTEVCIVTSKTDNRTIKKLLSLKGVLILDSSFSRYRTNKLKKEQVLPTQKVYWVSENGAFVLN